MHSPVGVYWRSARYYVYFLIALPLLARGVLLSMQPLNSYTLTQGVNVLWRGVAHDFLWMVLLSCPLAGATVWLNRSDMGKILACVLRFAATLVGLCALWQMAAGWLTQQQWPNSAQLMLQWYPMQWWGVLAVVGAAIVSWPKPRPRVYRVGGERLVAGTSYIWFAHALLAVLALIVTLRGAHVVPQYNFLKQLARSPLLALRDAAPEPVVVPVVVVPPVPVELPPAPPPVVITPPVIVPPPPAPVPAPVVTPEPPVEAPPPVAKKPRKVHVRPVAPEVAPEPAPVPKKRSPANDDATPPSGIIRNGVVVPL